jgi:hypothetical protein
MIRGSADLSRNGNSGVAPPQILGGLFEASKLSIVWLERVASGFAKETLRSNTPRVPVVRGRQLMAEPGVLAKVSCTAVRSRR